MADKLTPKQKKFVKGYLETGVATQAAVVAYPNATYDTQRQIGSENLTKPYILDAIRAGQKDELVEKAFEQLISLKRLDYFMFPKSMSDEEITAHVEAQGITVLNVRPTDKGKMAFFAIPDGQALARALDMVAKIQGSYAAEKRINLNVDVEASDKIKELAKKMNQ